ncbi:MAG TPA: PqqD family protein [Chloroflexota bacterium]|nr:PqqD family protein [Chloroflexota bacterium]
MPIDRASTPRRNEQVISQSFEDTLLLLHPTTGEYYSLDEVGGRVWELCDGTRSVAQVIATIDEEFDAPMAEIAADVLELLGELADEQLVVAA